jgi:hypothetical protein
MSKTFLHYFQLALFSTCTIFNPALVFQTTTKLMAAFEIHFMELQFPMAVRLRSGHQLQDPRAEFRRYELEQRWPKIMQQRI